MTVVSDLGVDVRSAVSAAASDVIAIEDVTTVVTPPGAIRVRGPLLVSADEAYRRLAQRLRPMERTPLLRHAEVQGRVEMLAVPGVLPEARQRVGLAALMFTLTVLSCLLAGAQMPEWVTATGTLNLNLLDGLPFTASLLAILGAHEFGHYLVGRRVGAQVSLPYFIPMPFGPFGTLGAFINMTAPPRDRRQLLAVAVAGPLAGLIVALPILWLGLSLSHLQPLPPAGGYIIEGNSLLYAGLKFLYFGRLLPSGGIDVFVHPVAFAGWAGLLVTGLNLLPAGQLDGGHIAFALFGERGARAVLWGVLALLVGLSFLWVGWVLWVAIIFFFSRVRMMPLDDITGLTAGQRVLAALMLVVFVLVFSPIPLISVPLR